VVTVSPHPAAAAESSVEGPGHPDCQPPGAPGENSLVVTLDDEVEMIALHGKVHDPEGGAAGRGDGGPDGGESPR
jgi:hypothetical protein